MARTGNAAAARALALAVSFLLLAIANGDLGHSFGGHHAGGQAPVGLATDDPPAEPDSAPPHSAPDCPLCQAARVASVVLPVGAVCSLVVPESPRAISLPEQVAPPAPSRRTETARAPPVRLAI
jgi:hypothetical protein